MPRFDRVGRFEAGHGTRCFHDERSLAVDSAERALTDRRFIFL